MTDREVMLKALDALEVLNGAETVDGIFIYTTDEIFALRQALAQPEQEPVAWMQDSIELYVNDRPTSIYKIPLYTAPPRKEWVGLTDDEIWAADSLDDLVWARNIEAKLKERNT